MANEKDILEQAKQLIIKKQYDEARKLLTPIQHNATAQKWLGKLDEVAPLARASFAPEKPVEAASPIPVSEPSSFPEPETPSTVAFSPLRQAASRLPDIDTSSVDTPMLPKVGPSPAIRPLEAPKPSDTSDFEPVSLEQLRPRKPPRQRGLDAESPEDKSRFEVVKEIFTQAQGILGQMPENRRAKKWSTRLDNIDKPYPGERFFDAGMDATPQQRILHFINESKSSQTRSDLQDFVNSSTFRYIMGGTAALMAVLIILGFFIFSWVEIALFATKPETMTPLQIWLGTNDEFGTLDIAKAAEEEETGFGDVRLLDRLLILIPPLAIGLLMVAVLYLRKQLPTKTALIALVGLSFALLMFGFFWRTFSTMNWRGGLKETADYEELPESVREDLDENIDEQIDVYKTFYSTGEHELYAFLAFTVTGLGLVLLIADERGMLEPDYA